MFISAQSINDLYDEFLGDLEIRTSNTLRTVNDEEDINGTTGAFCRRHLDSKINIKTLICNKSEWKMDSYVATATLCRKSGIRCEFH